MAEPTAMKPEWIAVWAGRHGYLVRFTDTEGRRHDWNVQFDNCDGTSRRRQMAWHAWPDIPDPDEWDKPLWLSRSIATARDEFLLVVVHGWRRGFGYADGDSARPIYGKPGARRERRFIVAELTGRGVCPRCPKLPRLLKNGTLNAHHEPRSSARCLGTHKPPAAETPLCGYCGEVGGHPGAMACPAWESAQRAAASVGLIQGLA